MKEKLQGILLDSLKKIGLDLPAEEIIVDIPKDISKGDYSTNIAMRFASKAAKAPMDLAKEIVENLVEDSDIEKVEFIAPGFINFYLSTSYLLKETEKIAKLGSEYFQFQINKDNKLLLEYTDANPFKILHIGHLYTNAVGESFARLQEALGAQVKRATYQGDVGLHVAKTLWGLEYKLNHEKKKFEDIEKLDLVGRVKYLGDAYIEGSLRYDSSENVEVKQEIDDINYYIFFITTPILEKKNFDKFLKSNLREKYIKGRIWCLDYFETVYSRLGTKFDYYFFESEVGEYGLQLVLKNVGGIFKKDDGAIIYEGNEEKGLHTRVFVNKYGLPTYEAKELGLAVRKEESIDYDKSIIITASEQSGYFKVVMDALSKLDPVIAKKTEHVSHGTVKLPGNKKMSSRKGGIISAEWLLDETKKKVVGVMKTNKYPSSDLEEVAEKIAVGAVKYAFLKVGVGEDIVFDFDKAISFDGDTGPYIQYVYSRCNSLIEEYGDKDVKSLCLDACLSIGYTRGLSRATSKYREVLLDSAKMYSPSTLCQYLFDLSKTFNSFYQNVRLSDTSEDEIGVLLLIVRAVMNIIEDGLNRLGIQVVGRM